MARRQVSDPPRAGDPRVLRTSVVLSLLLIATSSAAKLDPASDLCDHGGGGSAGDQAVRIIRFHQETERNLTPLAKRHAECVARRLSQIEDSVESYCQERSSLGHDLATDELWELDVALSSLYTDCSSEEYDQRREVLESVRPNSCSEVTSSVEAWLKIDELTEGMSESQKGCFHDSLDSLAEPLQALCGSGDLSVAASYVELGERLAKACPGDPADD